jgi:hypothetical protein
MKKHKVYFDDMLYVITIDKQEYRAKTSRYFLDFIYILLSYSQQILYQKEPRPTMYVSEKKVQLFLKEFNTLNKI